MTDADPLARLDALAAAATPGPWKVVPSLHGGKKYKSIQYGADEMYTSLEMWTADANFCAACSPEVVRALIACVRAADLVCELADHNTDSPGCERCESVQAFNRARAALDEAMR